MLFWVMLMLDGFIAVSYITNKSRGERNIRSEGNPSYTIRTEKSRIFLFRSDSQPVSHTWSVDAASNDTASPSNRSGATDVL
jgi:hypothetical protein